MKKYISSFAFFLIFVTLISCGKKNNDSDSSKNTRKEIPKTKITFLHYFSSSLSGGIDSMVSKFNTKNSFYELDAIPLDHESFKTSIKTSLNQGTPPDIYSYWAGARVNSIIDKLEPIDDIWKEKNLDQLFSSSVINSACTYNGKKFFIPITQHYVAFFYNKHIFEKNNLSVPKNWNEFLKICDIIKKSGTIPIALGSKQKWPAQFWFDYLLLRTSSYEYREKLMSGKASYTDIEVKNVMKIWLELIDRGYFNTSPNNVDWDTGANEMVYKGEAAMTLMGTWIIGGYSDASHNWVQEKDYDFFSFPLINENIPFAALGPIDGLIIPFKSLNKSGAKEVLYYLTDIENQKAMSTGSGALAPNILISEDFYSNMQKKIIKDINKAEFWAFNYDLATPPSEADLGLKMFAEFLEFPNEYELILNRLENNLKRIR